MWTSGAVRVQVTLRGDAHYDEGDQARAAVERAIAAAHCPVRRADVVLYARHEPSAAAEVEALVDVGGAQVHAAGAAATVTEATDVLESRLGAGLARITHRAQAARRVPRRPRRPMR